MRSMGIGVLGANGNHAQHHIKNLGPHFHVVRVCDPAFDDASWRGGSPDGYAADVDELLADVAVEAVLIMSPDVDHYQQAKLALECSKHVFLEKPMITAPQEIGDLSELFDLAKSKGLVLTTCHLRRFDRPFMWLKENMDRLIGSYGKITQFHYTFQYPIPKNGWKLDANMRTLLEDHMSHENDSVSCICDPCGFRARKIMNSPVEYVVDGVRDDGIKFHFHGQRLTPRAARREDNRFDETVHLYFENGYLRMEMLDGNVIESTSDAKEGFVENACTLESCAIDYDGRLLRTMEAFRREIEGEPGYLSPVQMCQNTEATLRLAADTTGEYIHFRWN